MKAYVSVVLVAIIIATYYSYIECDKAADIALKQVIDQCLEKHHISKESVDSIVNHQSVPDDHEVKCWLSCVMKTLGMIKEGKIDWEHCKNLTKQDLTSEEDKTKIDKIVDICKVQVPQEEKDECELAFSAAVCKIKNWKEFGLPKRNM
nr:odorant binding protein 14 [Graphosoma rubrolineatum]